MGLLISTSWAHSRFWMFVRRAGFRTGLMALRCERCRADGSIHFHKGAGVCTHCGWEQIVNVGRTARCSAIEFCVPICTRHCSSDL